MRYKNKKAMDKKMLIGTVAVFAFFGGAFWVTKVPVVATLVAFLELGIGACIGYWFKKVQEEEATKKTLKIKVPTKAITKKKTPKEKIAEVKKTTKVTTTNKK